MSKDRTNTATGPRLGESAGPPHAVRATATREATQVLLCQGASTIVLSRERSRFRFTRESVLGERPARRELASAGERVRGFRRLPELTELDTAQRERRERRDRFTRMLAHDALEKPRRFEGMPGEARSVGGTQEVVRVVAH